MPTGAAGLKTDLQGGTGHDGKGGCHDWNPPFSCSVLAHLVELTEFQQSENKNPHDGEDPHDAHEGTQRRPDKLKKKGQAQSDRIDVGLR